MPSNPSQTVELHCHIKATPEKVFDFFSDHESFGRIWPGKTTRIKTSDNPHNPNDVGSIRRVRIGPISFDETQMTCDRPSLIEYTVTRGSPIKNHWGRIRLTPTGDGTEIDYVIAFDPKIPGTGGLIKRDLEKNWAKGIAPVIRELEEGEPGS